MALEWPDLYPHQRDFIFNTAPYPTLWGSWGSAKTWALVMRVMMLLTDTDFFGKLSGNRGVLGRQVAKDLRDTTLKDFFDLLPPKWIHRYNRAEMTLELLGGSELILAHFDDFKIGANLGFAAIDQMEEVTQESFERLQGRARLTRLRTGETLNYRSVFGVGNTNGRASWHFRRWEQNRLDYLAGRKFDARFWTHPSLTMYDNPSLPDDYVKNVQETMSEKKWRIFGLGSWEALEGQILEDFNPASCVNASNYIPPTSWRKYIGIDHASSSGVKAAIFGAVDEEWNTLIYDEVYGAECQVEDFCRMVRDRLEAHEIEMAETEGRHPARLEHITLWPCDRSMQRKVEDDATLTLTKLYAQHADRLDFRMSLYPADNSIDAGIDKLNWLFRNNAPDRESLPKLRINPRCRNFISAAQSYVYDEKTGKPKEGQDDHTIDALRYLCSTVYVGDFARRALASSYEPKSFAEQVIDDMQLSNHPNDLNDYLTSIYQGQVA